jgi:integrase
MPTISGAHLRDIFPAIGDISVTEIKAHTLVKAVQPVQARGALETVRRLCQRINEVMIYAQNTGLIDAVPSVNIGKAFEKPQKKNMPSIRPDQLPQLMQTMRTASISVNAVLVHVAASHHYPPCRSC